MNLIPKICEMLGVKVGEKFYIGSEEKIEGAYYFYGDKKVIKLPFKPKEMERYWYVYVGDDEIGNTRFTEANTNDLMRVYCGNCFRTKAEAEKHKYEIYERLTGRKWEHENAD